MFEPHTEYCVRFKMVKIEEARVPLPISAQSVLKTHVFGAKKNRAQRKFKSGEKLGYWG